MTKYNPDKICRICLSESEELNSIFENANNISNVLMSLASIILDKNEIWLPTKICTSCIFEATNACFFKEKCEQSDKLLRNALQTFASSNNVKEEVLLQHSDELDKLFHNDGTAAGIFEPDDVRNDDTLLNQVFLSKNELNLNENMQNTEHDLCDVETEDLDDQFQSNFNDNIVEEQQQMTANDDSSNVKLHKRKRNKTNLINTVVVEIRNKFQCEICNEQFEKKIDLKRHTLADHAQIDGERNLECIECNKRYPNDVTLNVHMRMHNNKTYQCESCPKLFYRLDYLVEHKKRHSGERSYVCVKCGKGFYNQMYLTRHMITHNKDHLEKMVYECSICGKQMHHSNHLKVHMWTHKERTAPLEPETDEKNEKKKLILCSVCGKSCSSRSNLSVHMRRHTGQMTNFCTVCGKGYPRTTDLTIHMRQHTGEKPFACKLCDRKFARSDKLAIHNRIHSGEKPYICSVCGRAFAQSNDLASHKRRNACSTAAKLQADALDQDQLNDFVVDMNNFVETKM